MSEIKELIGKIKKFNEERDWEQFHNHKDLAISLCLEAAEVLEHFQWKSEAEIKEYVKNNRQEIAEEVADVFIYLLQLAEGLGIDIIKASHKKIAKNGKKYPVAKSVGKATKYNKL